MTPHTVVHPTLFGPHEIHDLLMEGVELALKKRGYPALAEMKAKSQRKER